MAEDPTEKNLGICLYRSPTVEGFSAVLKGRFSDFVVHEVGTDGVKAELTYLAPTILTDEQAPDASAVEESIENRKRKREVANSIDCDKPPLVNEDSSIARTDAQTIFDLSETHLTELIDLLQDDAGDSNGDATKLAQDLHQFLKNEPDVQRKFVSLPTSNDKQKRRLLHEWIRSRLANIALADTAEEAGIKVIRVWHMAFAREMPNYGKFDRPAKVKPSKKFLRFVVYKENLDTNSAMQQILRKCGGGKGRHTIRLGFAGMKDKRGITSQFFTMPARSSIENLLKAVNPAKTEHNKNDGGGHTDIAGAAVLRIGNFVYVDQDLRLGRLQGNRFDIALRNIQMPQTRTESREILAQVAKALGTRGFINYFGVQRFGKYYDTHSVGIAMLQQDFAKAVDLIMQPRPDEREPTAQARIQWKERFANLPENSARDAKAAAEKRCAERIMRDFGRFMHNEIAVLRSLAKYPLDYRRAMSSITKTMKMMFVHALQSLLWNHAATFRLQQLGDNVIEGDLVLEGSEEGEKNGIPNVRFVTAEDVSKDCYTLEDVVLPLIGSKIMVPKNATADIFAEVLGQHKLNRESFDVRDRDLNCAGDYRKLLVRPTDVDYDIIEYTDPRQPLVQTDLMKLQGIKIQEVDGTKQSPLLGMRVGFTLPPSAYATIALRELMKRPTSAEYQKDLSLEGSP